MQYICPKELSSLFEEEFDEEKLSIARGKILDWLNSLELKIGDEIWLPEVGWIEKTGYCRNN